MLVAVLAVEGWRCGASRLKMEKQLLLYEREKSGFRNGTAASGYVCGTTKPHATGRDSSCGTLKKGDPKTSLLTRVNV